MIYAPCEKPLEKIEALYGCLTRVNQYFDQAAALPLHILPRITAVDWLELMHVFIVLAKLSFLILPDWDLQHVRNTISFSAVADRFNERFTAVQEQERHHSYSCAPNNALPRFAAYVRKMTQCKKWFEAKVDIEARQSRSPQHANDIVLENDLFINEILDGFDEWSWQEFLDGYDTDHLAQG